MSRYAHVRSLDHAERILRTQAHNVRTLACEVDHPAAAAAMRGKAGAYSEAADLLAVIQRKWRAGELDEFTSAVAQCESAIQYATEEQDCSQGAPLPDVPLLQCELLAGHEGSHSAGVHNWTRVDLLEPAS